MMLAIINAEIIMPDHIIPDGYLLIENEQIKDYGTMDKIGEIELHRQVMMCIYER